MITPRFYASLSLLALMFAVQVEAYCAEIISVAQTTSRAIRYEKIEFDITVASTYANPFDQNDIAVDLEFTDPDGITLVLPCFFVNGNTVQSVWRARFSAKKIGAYQVSAILKNAGVSTHSLTGPSFTVDNSAKPGFLRVHDHWTMAFDNGQPFRGVGENFGWEPTSTNGKHTYDYLLPHLKDHGVNFFRTWMCNWNFPLEWKTTNSPWYTSSPEYFNPSGIARMDEVVDMIDSLDLKMMLAFDYHGAFMTNTAWSLNNYNKVNGGPVNTPAEFFTAPAAKAMYKNRLRYIVARWGYSTGIAVWEFFNEIDNAMYNGEAIVIPHAAVTQWHAEMSTYLKSIDPFDHIVSTSISHRQITGLFAVPDIDINQQHVYKNTGGIPSMIMNNSGTKPFVVGEFAYEWDWNIDFQTIATAMDFDFKRGLWYGLFSSTSILPMSWWWEFFHDRGTDQYYQAVREISDHMIAAGKGSFTRMPVSSAGGSIEIFAMKCGSQYFVYAVNTSPSSVQNKTISFSVADDRSLQVIFFNPETMIYQPLDPVTTASKKVDIQKINFVGRESKIFLLSEPQDRTGFKLPYNNVPHSIPGIIQMENFDTGGEGISYHDLESVNNGGAYRTTEGVDIVSIAPNEYVVSNMVRGEWLDYTVDVTKRATYTMKIKASAIHAGKKMKVTLNGAVVFSEVLIPSTGSLDSWTTVTLPTPLLDQGIQQLRVWCEDSDLAIDAIGFVVDHVAPTLTMLTPTHNATVTLPDAVVFSAEAQDEDGTVIKVEFYNGTTKLGEDVEAPFNFSWSAPAGLHAVSVKAFDDHGLSVSHAVSVTVSPSTIQEPFLGTPIQLPGKVEAENIDKGASTIAFVDNTPGNIKEEYRTDTGADIEICNDVNGGYNLADIQAGEWVEYSVSVAETGRYDFSFRVATSMNNQRFRLLINNVSAGIINVPNTGAWQTWQNVVMNNVPLPAGDAVLRFAFDTEFFNLNYFTVEKSIVADVSGGIARHAIVYPNPSTQDFSLVSSVPIKKIAVTNMQGVTVLIDEKISEERRYGNSLASGLYVIVVEFINGSRQQVKLMKQ
ncbi:carbohydrate-binding protein [Pseudochryseolinea flava]|uniref:CBM6 domain-containing protein n=1 Tax=Pseudochryseolinea flava TaxID=2059302 RepID=A0A364Y2P5_9BACT|nr:carbohydrate-binding protein [Pseudochryseolinea flava]RAW00969.1 hypothetical protein DQQ10_12065 [Pseudochryseolinea flava]